MFRLDVFYSCFQKTQRLQVNLPRAQKMVLRVKPTSTLAEIYSTVCREKNLDSTMYEIRNPGHPTQPLSMSSTLQEHQLHEITVAMTSIGITMVQHQQHEHQISKYRPYREV